MVQKVAKKVSPGAATIIRMTSLWRDQIWTEIKLEKDHGDFIWIEISLIPR